MMTSSSFAVGPIHGSQFNLIAPGVAEYCPVLATQSSTVNEVTLRETTLIVKVTLSFSESVRKWRNILGSKLLR